MTPPGPPDAWSPRPYHQVLRGPAHRWWRPLLGLGVVLAGLAVILLGTLAVTVVAAAVGAVRLEDPADALDEWWVLLVTNVGLAALIPVSALAVLAGHGWRPGFLSSVEGRLRWRWLLVCAAVSAVVLVGGTAVLWGVGGVPSGRGGEDVVLLLAVVLLTTPLQAAGEEYLFRGWLTQAVGSWLRGPVVSAVVAALVSASLFALAHGAQNAWLFTDRFAFGLLGSYLVWRTGGLEAAIAVHALNNVVVLVPTVLTGGLADALSVTSAPALPVLLDLAVMAVTGVALTLAARRAGVRRLLVPPSPAAGVLAPSRPLG
ncbi:CPBP family intramembrane metalloprotease [Kineosporiaceae bacterium SCSIO 59966]|nr:CPBP family intramembrane metalloprotease [Kineosporiaceae bacterium SCSIO 59966]